MCVFLVQVPGNNLHKDNKSENCIQNYELESLREKKNVIHQRIYGKS